MNGEARMACFVERLKERSDEIKFQIELVKRCVENMRRDVDEMDQHALFYGDQRHLSGLN